MSAGDFNPEGWIWNDAIGWTRRETQTCDTLPPMYTWKPRRASDYAEPLETISGNLPDLSRTPDEVDERKALLARIDALERDFAALQKRLDALEGDGK